MADKKDLFYLDKVFPEADKIFSESFKSPSEIIEDCIIVLDTNVLLVLFDANEKNVSDIKDIYLKYKGENRLFIPSRVAREFANNRANKIGDIFLQLRQVKDNLNSGNFKLNQYPILENNEDYKKTLEQFNTIRESIKAARKYIENIEEDIQGWTWNDSVSTAYKEVFTPDLIIELKCAPDDLEKDLAFRIEYKVAPGYKDSKKPDDGVGDLIIWKTILEIAKDKNKDLLFPPVLVFFTNTLAQDKYSTVTKFKRTNWQFPVRILSGAHSLKPALVAGFAFHPNGKVEPFYSTKPYIFFMKKSLIWFKEMSMWGTISKPAP